MGSNTFLFCYRNLLPTTPPLLQRPLQHSNVMGKRRGMKRCPNQRHTHRSDKSSAGVLHPHLHYTFHIGTHILVLPLLAQSSLSVRNTLSSILQNQSLNFYLNLDSAVCDTSDENSKLCWIRKLLNFSSSHPTPLTDYLKA